MANITSGIPRCESVTYDQYTMSMQLLLFCIPDAYLAFHLSQGITILVTNKFQELFI